MRGFLNFYILILLPLNVLSFGNIITCYESLGYKYSAPLEKQSYTGFLNYNSTETIISLNLTDDDIITKLHYDIFFYGNNTSSTQNTSFEMVIRCLNVFKGDSNTSGYISPMMFCGKSDCACFKGWTVINTPNISIIGDGFISDDSYIGYSITILYVKSISSSCWILISATLIVIAILGGICFTALIWQIIRYYRAMKMGKKDYIFIN
jgi:hypothetical protein